MTTDGGPIPGIPDGCSLTRTTEVFDEGSVPRGLLRAHRVADGVWGRLVVCAGELRFVFEDEPDEPRHVVAGESVPIPPGRLHHVEVAQPVRFVVEFYRRDATAEGVDSTGLV